MNIACRNGAIGCIAWVIAITSMLMSNFSRAQVTVKAERGITRTYEFTYDGPPLRAKTLRDADSPLVVRIQRGEKRSQYLVHFIGSVAGQFDLAEWLENSDGSPLIMATPLTVEIVSTLPADRRSDLFEVDTFQPGFQGGYRWILLLSVLGWLAIPAMVLLRRWLNKKVELAPEAIRPPVPLWEQVQELIQSATHRELSIGEKARLELLLIHYLREQADLSQEDLVNAMRALKKHPEAGPIVRAVETWLHEKSPNGQGASIPELLSRMASQSGKPGSSASFLMAEAHTT